MLVTIQPQPDARHADAALPQISNALQHPAGTDRLLFFYDNIRRTDAIGEEQAMP
ncbi:MAG: hypothetical protein JO338_11660 [Aquitalea sp.]|nr:hypothetical protein [Aquitalea sp.]